MAPAGGTQLEWSGRRVAAGESRRRGGAR
jgi:hypothetical protein